MHLAGRWIMPGLIDAHVHFSQTGWVDGRPDALDRRADHPFERVHAGLEARPERFLRSYVCSGVTSVFDVGGFAWTWALRRRAETDLESPRVAAAGPLLSTVGRAILDLPDARQIMNVADDSAAIYAVRAHVARGTDAIKIWYIMGRTSDTAALQRRVRLIGAEARRLNTRLIVHATSLWTATDALEAGANMLVHSVEDRPVDENFLRLARQNRVVYTPTLTVYDGYRQVRERRFEPHYPLDCVDSATVAHARATDTIPGGSAAAASGERLRMTMANLAAIHRAGITVAMGTDAGNPLTLHGPSVYREMETMEQAGLSIMDVLRASTLGGAIAMGRERDLGTIEAGKLADLLVLDSDPTQALRNVRDIRYVMRGGSLTIPELLRQNR
jgi:imidazolonepropionase-like amidohydrolase